MSIDWDSNPPATENEINQLKKAASFKIPEDYFSLLKKFNGGEGELNLPPMWLRLWEVEEVIDTLDIESYQEDFPNLFFFASNGGMELIAFREIAPSQTDIVMVDPVAGVDSIESIATDFKEFEEAIGTPFEDDVQ